MGLSHSARHNARFLAQLEICIKSIGYGKPNAEAVAGAIRRRADGIEAPPLGGGKVPELNDEQVCEIRAYPRRVLHHLREDQVFIVTLVHKRRRSSGS